MRLLRRGSRGKDVAHLQKRLGGLVVDGIFGPATESAVLRFQRANGLKVDGIVGPQTRGFLENRPVKEPSPTPPRPVPGASYRREGITHIVELDPLMLKNSVQDRAAHMIPLANYMTGGYQWHHANGVTFPLGVVVSEGRVISNRQPHGKPAGTFIVYRDGRVECKPVLTLDPKDVWFAVSGCSILPTIRMTPEGFTGPFADIGRSTARPVIGYNAGRKKVVLALRNPATIQRGQDTLRNLGCDFGITLDGGGSAALKVNNRILHRTTRRLYSVITW